MSERTRLIKGAERLRELGRRFRSRFVSGGLILMFHRVSDPRSTPLGDPYRLCVSPEHFEEHLETIRSLGHVVSLQDLVRRVASGRSVKGCIAVTFDDGYVDNLSTARPLLERRATPATFFVTAGALGRPFWWDQLASAIASSEELPGRRPIEYGGRLYHWIPRGAGIATRLQLLRFLHRLMRRASPDTRTLLMDQLGLAREVGADGHAGTRAVGESELIELGSNDLFELGAHGFTHLPFSSLAATQQHRELEDARDLLEQVSGARPTSFSYPYGGRLDYTADTVRLVEAAGYERACTATLGVVTASSDTLRLPRLWVRDWSAHELARELGRWLR